jgi:hypothetical protein
MKPTAEWDEAYVLSLPSGEFDWVEFKSSRLLDLLLPRVKEADVRNELSKQLSAFSNSGGGALVYGIADPVAGQPLQVDGGGVSVDCKDKSTKEWLEDIIPNLVEFPITRFNVYPIGPSDAASGIAAGKAIFVIEIPDSEQAPHQATDRKYYARIGGKSVPVSHRFVADIFGRSKYPQLEMVFGVTRGAEDDDLLILRAWCRNSGRVLARFVVIEILLPWGLLPAQAYNAAKGEKRYARFRFDNAEAERTSGPLSVGRANRYAPILPSRGFEVHLQAMLNVLTKHDNADAKIHWRIYADNAPPAIGEVALGQVSPHEVWPPDDDWSETR